MKDANGRPGSIYPVDFSKVALKKGDPFTELWLSGYVRGHRDWYFSAKVFDRGSRFGIYDGRISKLEVYERDRLVMHYERGWITRPPTQDHHEILNKIIGAFPEPTVQQYRDFRRAQREDRQEPTRQRRTRSEDHQRGM